MNEKDKIDEIFKMAFHTDFSDNEFGKILKAAYEEDKEPKVMSIIERYMSHNDYLLLKNELTEFAQDKKEAEDSEE